MSLNFFTNFFSRKTQEEKIPEDIKPPERKISISKTGRLREKNKVRLSLSEDTFTTTEKAKCNVKDAEKGG